MTARTPRRGSALLELIVALPLTVLIAGLATAVLVSSLRLAHRVESRVHNARELRHAAAALAANLRASGPPDLISWSDTSMQLHANVYVGVICAAPAPGVLDVLAADGGHVLHAIATGNPRVGDRAVVARYDTTLAGLPPDTVSIEGRYAAVSGAAPEPSACADSPLRAVATGTPLRLQVADGLFPVELGDVVAVQRRVEWRSYRASDTRWYLGRREFNGLSWDVIQPVAGPLASNANGGFRVAVRDAAGTVLDDGAAAGARTARIALRAVRRGRQGDALIDSLILAFALRGGR